MGGTVQRIVNLGGGRGFLRENAAKSLHRIDKRIGHRCQMTETLRTWAQQNAHYQHYLKYGSPIALSPDGPPKGNGPSIHQKGEAFDSDEMQNHVALAADHGFIRTVYRWVNGKWTLVERWHFEYFAERDNHRGEVVKLIQTSSGAWHLPDPKPPVKPAIEKRDIEMRIILNKDDKDEYTRRALVGELVFQTLTPRAATREAKLWGAPVSVPAADFDGCLATVNARREAAKLAPLPNPRNR